MSHTPLFYITMRSIGLTLARIAEQIIWAARFHNIEMDEDELLNDAVKELKDLATSLCDAFEYEKSNETKVN